MDYKQDLQSYIDQEIKVIRSLDLDSISVVMNLLEKKRQAGGRIFICGNGGSATTASHFCCDFNKGVNENKDQKYCFECLNDNIPMLTALANDISYNEIFRHPLKCKMKKEDLLIGISGSGNSENVINAIKYANSIGGTTIAIVGYNGGIMKKIADYNIHVNIDNMQISEDIHIILNHMMMYVLSKEDSVSSL